VKRIKSDAGEGPPSVTSILPLIETRRPVKIRYGRTALLLVDLEAHITAGTKLAVTPSENGLCMGLVIKLRGHGVRQPRGFLVRGAQHSFLRSETSPSAWATQLVVQTE